MGIIEIDQVDFLEVASLKLPTYFGEFDFRFDMALGNSQTSTAVAITIGQKSSATAVDFGLLSITDNS